MTRLLSIKYNSETNYTFINKQRGNLCLYKKDSIYSTMDTEQISLKYINGAMYVYQNNKTIRRYWFLNYTVLHHLSYKYTDTLTLMEQLAQLLAGNSMNIDIECVWPYDVNSKFTDCIFIGICYDSVTKQCTFKVPHAHITFTYYEYKHKQAFDDMFNAFYFAVGHKLVGCRQFKQQLINAIIGTPNITPQQFMDTIL